ncbi:MAG: cupin domain-containing protein [Neorhizobium sp.]|nr:cupin domain-containing protein [Neorhizobium sp.]
MLLNLERLEFLVAQYVSGALPEAAHVLVGSHLEMQGVNGLNPKLAGVMQELAGEALAAIEPVPLRSRASSLEDIMSSRPSRQGLGSGAGQDGGEPADDADLPKLLRAYTGRALATIPWRRKLPGLQEYVIEKGAGIETSLLLARPGRALPSHGHTGLELTLVLDGQFQDYRGRFGEGDVSVADEEIDHRPVASDRGPCLCFSVLLAPITLSGPPLGLVRDVLGI